MTKAFGKVPIPKLFQKFPIIRSRSPPFLVIYVSQEPLLETRGKLLKAKMTSDLLFHYLQWKSSKLSVYTIHDKSFLELGTFYRSPPPQTVSRCIRYLPPPPLQWMVHIISTGPAAAPPTQVSVIFSLHNNQFSCRDHLQNKFYWNLTLPIKLQGLLPASFHSKSPLRTKFVACFTANYRTSRHWSFVPQNLWLDYSGTHLKFLQSARPLSCAILLCPYMPQKWEILISERYAFSVFHQILRFAELLPWLIILNYYWSKSVQFMALVLIDDCRLVASLPLALYYTK